MGNTSSSKGGDGDPFADLMGAGMCCCQSDGEIEHQRTVQRPLAPSMQTRPTFADGRTERDRWDLQNSAPTVSGKQSLRPPPGSADYHSHHEREAPRAPAGNDGGLTNDQKAKIILDKPKQGVLWKKGKWTRKWMKRWVSVTGDHIIYYGCEKDRSEGTHQPKGTIDIAGCVIRTQDHPTQRHDHKTGSKFSHGKMSQDELLWKFQVIDKNHHDKLFELACEHEEDRAAWIQNILLRRAAVRSVENSRESSPVQGFSPEQQRANM